MEKHRFVISIPVADRPQHLENCLTSIIGLCQQYDYAPLQNDRYQFVSIIIADDSKSSEAITQNQDIAKRFTDQGLDITYFGQEQQLAQVNKLSPTQQQQLTGIIGDITPSAFAHKGASIMRNITYLKLDEIRNNSREKLLFYFIDSDQEFRVLVNSEQGDQEPYLIDYFHDLNEIFSNTDTQILTGKVVGDPPVSPAVMAANFVDDVRLFLQQMATKTPTQACQFHDNNKQTANDAAYHDMAKLFGFENPADAYNYQCKLSGTHDHTRCFRDFSQQLNRFFYGEHATRKSYFDTAESTTKTIEARTIYTGNYIFRPDALKYFIPFAKLKLRMAGPVLGRLIKADIGERFVSANLPMLHKRTVNETGASEFRPGINQLAENIDISNEFERQYFGDLMLFTVIQLTELGYPEIPLSENDIVAQLAAMDKKILSQYQEAQQQVRHNLDLLKNIFYDEKHWWHQQSTLAAARQRFQSFIDNIEYNFDANAKGYQQIIDAQHKHQRHQQIVQALLQYPEDQQHWQALF